MPICAVLTCKYNQEGHDGVADGISFHIFPTDAELKTKWVEMTGRDQWVPTTRDFICSRHFRDHDYIVKRSGKRYLKTSAVPCEYVVYRYVRYDEDVEVKLETEESSAASLAPASNTHAVEPEQPGTSSATSRLNLPAPGNEEPDSTIGTDDWEQFRPELYFGQRLPDSIFEENSQDVGSSSAFDDRYRRDVGSSSNPYPPLELNPHLQQLPPPRTPEPQNPSPDEKLEKIGRIISRKKSSRKAIEAKHAEVREVLKTKILLQSGQMTDSDKASAIISIQTKQIEKITIKHRRLKKTIKRISAILRNAD